MKQTFLTLVILSHFLGPSCQHPEIVDPTEPTNPDTTLVLSCEDTIEVNFPGGLENGFISAIKTCRIWKASGKAIKPGISTNHLFVSGYTYFQHIGTNNDTTYLLAEGLVFTIPKKLGKFPVTSEYGFRQDTVRVNFSYLDVDVAVADWVVDNAYTENEVEIVELDIANKRVKGKFNIQLKIDTLSIDHKKYPSKLYFYDGEFDVEIVD